MNAPTRLSSINAVRPGRTQMRDYDLVLACVVGALLILGVIMVYSASIAFVDGTRFTELTNRYRFFYMQLIYVAIGLFAAYLVFNIEMSRWLKWAWPIFGISVFFLILVLVPFIGREINGAHRWIPLGPVNFQPSELAKLAMVLVTASYAVRKQEKLQSVIKGLLPIVVVLGVVAVLILREPDLGATVVVGVICLGILFLGGLGVWMFIGMIGLALVGVGMMVWITPWRMQRLLAYRDPFSDEHAQSTGYQLVHSLIAIGRGEWSGVGLGFSVEKLHYLPEAHTDFILAVIGEELGFVGIVGVIILFFIFVHKGMRIGGRAIVMDRVFSGLVAQGVTLWIGFQAVFNLCVCLGLFPTKGLTLPLVSYGGSAMVMTLAAIGFIFRVDYENRQMMRGRSIPSGGERG